MKKKTKKRLVQGRDWHAWTWKFGKSWDTPGQLGCFAEPFKLAKMVSETGKWVRVRFVEVKP